VTAPGDGPGRLSARTTGLVLAAIVGLAVVRAAGPSGALAATWDETQHLAAGLDWLGGSYTLWRDQKVPHVIVTPPLARVAVALGPYLAGLRLGPLRDLPYAGPGYARNLALARAGVLPFLALAIVLTWALARRALEDDRLALVAAAIFSLCPVVLAHGGLATTDVPFAAMTLLFLLAFFAWLEGPTFRRAVGLGAAFGACVATKLAAPLLILLAFVAVLVRRRVTGEPAARGARTKQLALAAAVAGLVVFAVYRFDVGAPRARADAAVLDDMIDACSPTKTGQRVARSFASTTLPAPALFDGAVALCAQNATGRSTSYLLGRISQDGFALFFPVALAVKTPLPLLALAALGAWLLLRRARAPGAPGSWIGYALPWLAVAFIAVAMSSRINIGVRHVLPIYPLMATLAALALGTLWRSPRRVSVAAATLLAVWLFVIPIAAAPDYLPWFNALAGRHPESVLLDSDLDWGQDLLRLQKSLAERHVGAVHVAYWGVSDLCRHVPNGRWLRPHERATGWIAISETYRKGVATFSYRDGDYCDPAQFVGSAPPDPTAYAWLDAYEPVARVGASILLYDIPEAR
jgi:4-amino-4-deoxy-L-arabinose transferase-like glycosyltransferase